MTHREQPGKYNSERTRSVVQQHLYTYHNLLATSLTMGIHSASVLIDREQQSMYNSERTRSVVQQCLYILVTTCYPPA